MTTFTNQTKSSPPSFTNTSRSTDVTFTNSAKSGLIAESQFLIDSSFRLIIEGSFVLLAQTSQSTSFTNTPKS